MANERKSIIDEALLESAQIEKAFEANAKEILTRTMSSEIEEMVKESLEGSIGLTEDEDEEKDELELDLELGDSDEMDASGAGEEVDLEMGDLEMDDETMDGEIEMDDVESIDLTTAEMPEVINVFKKMSDDDEIEVVTDGGNVEIKDTETGAEYRIELGGEESEMEDMEADMVDMEPEMGDMEDMELDDEDESEEEIEYQVVLDDEDDEEEEEEMDDEMSEGDYMDDMEEGKSPRTLSKAGKLPNRKSSDINSNRVKMGESKKPKFLKLINENKNLKDKVGSITSENETLKEDYNKMVDALKQFRDKLNEVAVFNSNLTYSVRLFTENTTTKEEKLEIIKRFDDVKTLKESKATYKGLVKEISKKEPIKESVEEKLNETKTSGSSTEINESQVYVNPELEKMKKLWDYQYKH
jgi:hypothetical protein